MLQTGDNRTTIVASLDSMLLTAISGMENSDPVELEMLQTMTRDRGTAMRRFGALLKTSPAIEA